MKFGNRILSRKVKCMKILRGNETNFGWNLEIFEDNWEKFEGNLKYLQYENNFQK